MENANDLTGRKLISNAVEDNIADVVKVRYMSAKEWIKNQIFHAVKQEPISIPKWGRLGTRIACKVDNWWRQDRFMEAMANGIIVTNTRNKLAARFFKLHMEIIDTSAI